MRKKIMSKRLYESIMKDVAKKVKRHLNENIISSEDNIINTIIDCLSENGILYTFAEQILNDEIEDIFTNKDFLKKLGEMLSDEISTIVYNEYHKDDYEDDYDPDVY